MDMAKKKKKKKKSLSYIETLARVRKSWGDIKPVSKIIESKKHKKPKYKQKEDNCDYENI